MQVFRLYYKILLRGMIVAVIMYVILFSIITITFTKLNGNPAEQAFTIEKCRVAIVNNDNSELSAALSSYLKSNSEYVELKDISEESLKDALFFRSTEYILIIPKNFEESFLKDDKLQLQTMSIPDSSSSALISTMVDKFLNTVNLYIKSDASADLTAILEKTEDDLNEEVKILFTDGKKSEEAPAFLYYFNYLVYPLIAILVLCVSGTTLIINKIDSKRRNVCAPISTSKFNFGLFLGNLTLSFGILTVFLAISAALYNGSLFTKMGILVILNAFIITTVCLSLSFLIANVAKESAVSAISTTLSLGACFLGGVFVPQSMLGETVRTVGVINPVFWYIKANNTLGSLTVFNYETLKPVIFSMVVQICFAIALLSISLVVIKQKRTQEQ